jgi:hypothetical protein
MADSDDIWEQALQEAYASAPVEEIILYTLELRHPSFINEDDVVSPIRLVKDYGVLLEEGDPDVYGWNLFLENDAPANAGEEVRFYSLMFDFELPAQQEGALPTIEITIDNVTRELSQYLDEAVKLDSPIELTYREYLLSNKEEPQFVLNGMTIQSVKSTVFQVTISASFADLINRNFPGKIYRPEEFRGLI